jgi:hypothetical protein
MAAQPARSASVPKIFMDRLRLARHLLVQAVAADFCWEQEHDSAAKSRNPCIFDGHCMWRPVLHRGLPRKKDGSEEHGIQEAQVAAGEMGWDRGITAAAIPGDAVH